jgi:hypothetical protein
MIRLTGPDGERVMTTVSSADEERTVHMIPRGPWVRGAYRIAIDTRLEDLAGNTFQRPFDLDLTEPGVRARDGLSVLYLQFQVILAATPVSPSVHGP